MAVSPTEGQEVASRLLDWQFLSGYEKERRIASMIINHWLQTLQTTFGGFPRDYTVIDIETSGFDPASDLILNIGHVIVEDGVVVDRLDALLDWTRGDHVDPNWLYARMDRCQRQMASNGLEYKMSFDRLQTYGEDPIGVLQAYHDLIVAQRAANYAFVMHNGYNFDAPRLCTHFKRWLGLDLEFGANEIWDTGMIEKASQLNAVPDPRESMRAWSRRVGGARTKGVKWSLDGHCVPKYDLVRRYNLNEADAHGAGYDSYVTYLLFETFRQLALEAPPPEATHGKNQNQDDDPGGRYGHLGG